jgi:hypothetical protein
MDKEKIAEMKEKEYFKVRTILEIVGKPKKHVEDTLKEYIKKIDSDKKYGILKKSVKRAKKIEGDLYSVFTEIEMYAKDFRAVLDFSIDYMPASIEIEEPKVININSAMASDLANDFLSRIHQVDMTAKALNQKNLILSKSIGILIQNAILILLNLGPKKKGDIAKYVGVSDEQLPTFLKKLKDEKKVKEVNGEYSLVA